MVSGVLGRLFGRSGKGPANGPEGSQGILKPYLSFLDAVESGLTRKVLDYVARGDGPLVLSTLQAKKSAIDQAAVAQMRLSYVSQPKSGPISDLMATAGAHLEWLARLSQVLGLVWGTHNFYRQQYSTQLNLAVKGLCSHLRHYNASAKGGDAHLTIEQVIAVTDLVNGRRADLLEFAFRQTYYNTLLSSFPDKPKAQAALLSTELPEIVEVLTRLDAAGREQLLIGLNESSVVFGTDGIDFLFSMVADGSAKVRDAVRAVLLKQDRVAVIDRALAKLDAPNVTLRTAMVQILGELGGPDADAALTARNAVEKSQAVRSLIAQFEQISWPAPRAKGGAGYQSVTGWIDLPAAVVLVDTDDRPFGNVELKELAAIDVQIRAAEEIEAVRRKARGWGTWFSPPAAEGLFAAFNRQGKPERPLKFSARAGHHFWMTKAMSRISPARRLWLAVVAEDSVDGVLGPNAGTPILQWLQESLDSGAFDLRTVFHAAEDAGVPAQPKQTYGRTTVFTDGSYAERYLRSYLTNSPYFRPLELQPISAVLPLLAENLHVLPEFLPPRSLTAAQNILALDLLKLMPALPQILLQPVLFAALGESAQARKAAQALLVGIPETEGAMIAALDDKRQSIRTNAAAFLARRGIKAALPKLVKSLKSEKSDSARAAMIAAIRTLGGDTSAYLGAKALEAEAQTLVSKLKPVAEDFLRPDTMPALRWRDGTPVAAVVPDAWIRLAHKLKAPGDAGLFGLYLDELHPQDAAAFGDWLLQGWIAFDTYKEPASEHYKKIMAQAQQAKSAGQGGYYANYTLEEVTAIFLTYYPNPYVSSGADSKGILALAVRATPALQAQVSAAYLKEHGKRVAQAKAVIDMLVASGTNEAVQRVVATATRFKQKSVREHAEAQVAALAEARGWTADTLADRSIPTGGLEEGGQMVLEVGEEARQYTVRLGSDLQLRLFNAEGREVKSLPTGKDVNTTEAKTQLAAAKTAVKTATIQQAGRLYEAMLAGRRWSIADWQADINAHPILNRLTERVIWRGLTAQGDMAVLFRPTPEGDLFNATGDDVDLSEVAQIDILHGAQIDPATVKAWRQHLVDFEVTPLFAQLTRPVLRPDPDDPKASQITDRTGWIIESLRLRSEAAKYGYDKGPAEDGGYYMTYIKGFPSAGLRAIIHFTGSGQDASNPPVALLQMGFETTAKGRNRSVTLSQVPPLLLSECWCDLHDIAAKAKFDADWQKKVNY